LKRLNDTAPAFPGVARSLSQFTVSDHNGDHRVLVMPILGPSLYSFQFFQNHDLGTRTARVAVRQALEILEYVHSKGVIHQGEPRTTIIEIADLTENSRRRS
jgi:serine/threonine protein kinase